MDSKLNIISFIAKMLIQETIAKMLIKTFDIFLQETRLTADELCYLKSIDVLC